MKQSRMQQLFADRQDITKPIGVSDDVWHEFVAHVGGKTIGQICRERNLGRSFVHQRFYEVEHKIDCPDWYKDKETTFEKRPEATSCRWCGREGWEPKHGTVYCSAGCKEAQYQHELSIGREDRRIKGLMPSLFKVILADAEDFTEAWDRLPAKARLKFCQRLDEFADRGPAESCHE